MNHVHSTPFLLVVLACAACPLEPVELGEQELEASSSDADTSVGATADDPSDPSAGGGVGAACGHGDFVPETSRVTFPALSCDELLCVYADSSEAPADTCDSDVDCNASNPGLQRFVCDVSAQQCLLDPAYVAQHSFCSMACEDDTDCLSDEPGACQSGFVCAAITTLGPAAGCRPLCVCNDDLDVNSSEAAARDCTQGEAPVCEETPGQGLCPD